MCVVCVCLRTVCCVCVQCAVCLLWVDVVDIFVVLLLLASFVPLSDLQKPINKSQKVFRYKFAWKHGV